MDKSNNGEMRAVKPNVESNTSLSQLDLPPRIVNLLTREGIAEIGELRLRMESDPGALLSIGGIGPQSMASIKNALESVEAEPQEDQEPAALLADKTEPEEKIKKEKKKVKKEAKAKKDMAKDEKADKKKAKKKDDKDKNKEVN